MFKVVRFWLKMQRKLPLVVILGATGSGKTKLSLELAKTFNGEIIGADSMQVYKGLDIITAKATKEEQAVAPHHLIDILEPHETFTVVEYRNRALKIMDDLFLSKKLPIIVGGTNYYIESLLWKILVSTGDTFVLSSSKDHELSSEELHNKLKILDPNMAKRLHPNNKRKILRSLEILWQSGRKHSEVLEEQQGSTGGSRSDGGLRYVNALIFKLQCEKSILDQRLNKRVDAMVEQGLVEELTNFHKLYNEHRIENSESPDYTKGVFQSIGFKEFHPYLMMSHEERHSDSGRVVFANCIEELKMVTRRYARKQDKWTKNRFLGRTDRAVPPMYGLDVSDLTQWTENVLVPATDIIQCYMSQSECKHKQLPVQVTDSTPNAQDESHVCETCNRVFVGAFQWNIHLKSHRHKRMLERKKRLAQNEDSESDRSKQ